MLKMKSKTTSALLKKYFDRKKKDNARFSLRSLARSMELAPSFLSEIFKGKKALPPKHLDRLIQILDIDHEAALEIKKSYLEFSEIAVLSKATLSSLKSSPKKPDWQLGEKAQREILRNWYLLPMLELTLTEDFDGNFSERLGLTKAAVAYGIKRLIELGLLSEVKGQYRKQQSQLAFSSATSQEDFRIFHRQMLQKAEEELSNNVPGAYDARLLTGAVITVDSKRIAELKNKLNGLLDEFSKDCMSSSGDEVYQFGVQFFPLSKNLPKKIRTKV